MLIWEIAAFYMATVKRTPENILPHLYQILESVFSDKPVANGLTATQIVLTGAKATLIRAGIGFVVGGLIGFILAILMTLSKTIKKIILPYLMIIQMIPILGMAPIVLAITGDINVSRIVIAALLTFYPVATNTFAGLSTVDREKIDLMYMCNANKFEIYLKTLIPNAIPYLFTGLKSSAPMAITASILVDTLQGDGGLGSLLSQSLKHAMSIYVFWQIVFFSAIIGILSFYLMGVLEKVMLPYRKLAKNK